MSAENNRDADLTIGSVSIWALGRPYDLTSHVIQAGLTFSF